MAPADQLAAIVADLEAEMDPAHLAENRALLARLERVMAIAGPAAGITVLSFAIDSTMAGRAPLNAALDAALDALEHA